MRNRFCLAVLLFCPAIVLGQATFGTITGTVTDSTGAVVPNTQVQVTNQGTNISRTSTTGAAGTYEVPNLNAGIYRVTSKAAGFKSSVVPKIEVTAFRIVRGAWRREVGEVGTEVTVQGAAPVIETDSSSIAGVKSIKDLNDLPLNIRSTVSGTGDSG